MIPSLRVMVLLGVLAFPATGCGFLFVHGPPAGHENLDYFSCTQSNAGPVLDIVWASLWGVTIAGTIVNEEEISSPAEAVAVSAGLAILGIASARTGYRKTSECRDAKRLQEERQQLGRGSSPANTPSYQAVQAVTITPANGTLAVGGRLQLTATARGANGADLGIRLFAWSSSNSAIASVSSTGLVTAYAPGTVVIAANSNNLVGTANVVVTALR